MKISLELINAILGYLGTKPYAEVAQLIAKIQQEAQESASSEDAP
jgi:sensor histidine kinase regulating citrate/malate metabolism